MASACRPPPWSASTSAASGCATCATGSSGSTVPPTSPRSRARPGAVPACGSASRFAPPGPRSDGRHPHRGRRRREAGARPPGRIPRRPGRREPPRAGGRRRVEEAVGRVRARLGAANSAPDWESVLKRLEEQRKVYVSQVPVHSGKRILIVPVADVLWFGVEYRLVYAHTAERAFMTNYTLRDLEERLDPALFFRAHKSNLVNLKHVKEIVPWFGGRYKLVMRD